MNDLKYIKVEENNWASASGPIMLYSGTLGPNVGIGIYDPYRKIGYLLHDAGNSILLNQFLEHVCDECADILGLKIFATGAGPEKVESLEGMNRYTLVYRKIVEEQLRGAFGKRQAHVYWPPDGHTAEMKLDALTGRIGIQFLGSNELETLLREDNC